MHKTHIHKQLKKGLADHLPQVNSIHLTKLLAKNMENDQQVHR
jgi:hypothetical protein